MIREKKPCLLKKLVMLAASIFLLQLFNQLLNSKNPNAELIGKVNQLKVERQKLLAEIQALKTDPRLIEKIAREEQGLVKAGEIKIVESSK